MSRRPAVFLDRDGVVIEDVGYLSCVEQVRLLPGVAHAIATLNKLDYAVVIITNQSGVARGYFDEDRVNEVHTHLQQLLRAEGARIDRFYFCPHHPSDECACRKPRPNMLLSAAKALSLDLTESWMIGDRASDAEAGHAAGCRTILVRSEHINSDTEVVGDLSGAIEFLLRESVPRNSA